LETYNLLDRHEVQLYLAKDRVCKTDVCITLLEPVAGVPPGYLLAHGSSVEPVGMFILLIITLLFSNTVVRPSGELPFNRPNGDTRARLILDLGVDTDTNIRE
jgi:hypothetical protein